MKKPIRDPRAHLMALNWAIAAVLIAIITLLVLFAAPANACSPTQQQQIKDRVLIECLLDGEGDVGRRKVICVLKQES